MNSPESRPIDDPEYMYGQILSLRALLLGIADLAVNPDDFRASGIEALEQLRASALPTGASDALLTAIDHTEDWLRASTAA